VTLAISNIIQEFKQAVERRVEEEYVRHGYAKSLLDGSTVKDEERMKAQTLEIVISRAVVASQAERSKKALTMGQLYAAVFPEGPGAQPGTVDQLDEIEHEVWTTLTRQVWSLTNPAPSGWIQARLGDALILCRGAVFPQLDKAVGVYVTEAPALILADSLDPEIAKLVRVAVKLRAHASMIATRHPELEAKVMAALGVGYQRVRSEAQLTAYSGNGRKPADQPAEQD
jgi:hypothetical protein